MHLLKQYQQAIAQQVKNNPDGGKKRYFQGFPPVLRMVQQAE
jgi:hypothetical protein